jgi:hypothetical protein
VALNEHDGVEEKMHGVDRRASDDSAASRRTPATTCTPVQSLDLGRRRPKRGAAGRQRRSSSREAEGVVGRPPAGGSYGGSWPPQSEGMTTEEGL